jgi:predicted signal transduction protein with EAL and GGDEF domain
LTNADMAMYHAKRRTQPGGRWHCFEESDTGQERMRQRVNLRARIEQALTNEHFTLVYQPVVSSYDGVVHHYEALVRMVDDDGRLLLPSEFIDVAETSGLISQIDCCVVQLACQELWRWRRQNLDVALGLNLSAQTLDTPGFVGFVTEQLERYQLSPTQLNFEITETLGSGEHGSGAADDARHPGPRLHVRARRLRCWFFFVAVPEAAAAELHQA